jgi:hypothetical protein
MVFSVQAAEPVSNPSETVTNGVELNSAKAILPPQQDSFPFGQNQRYSVVFRGNGEAIITLSTAFSNTTDQKLSELKFRVPKGIPSDVIAYQIIGQRQCIQYDYSKQRLSPLSSVAPSQPPCIQYQEADFNQYVSGYNVKYQKATTDLATDTIIVTLPQPITANGAGGVMLYYRVIGYAKKDIFGGYNFSFETLKVEDKIQKLQVGISTDSDLLLKKTDSSVNYRFADTSEMLKTQTAAGMAAPTTNAQFDSFYHQIGQGSIVKYSSNLQPLDSYIVTGRYAKSSLQLYAKELAIGMGIFIVFVLIIASLVRWAFHKWMKKGSQKNAQMLAVHPVVSALIASFGSALGVVIYTIVLMVIIRMLTRYMSSDMEGLVMALLLVVSFGIYGLILFAAPIVIGIKRGLVWGVVTLGVTIGWIIGFIVFLLLFFFITHGTPVYQYPMMMRASSGVSVPEPSVDMMEKSLDK